MKGVRQDIYNQASPAAKAALSTYSPNGCFQGQIDKLGLTEPIPLGDIGGGQVTISPGDEGATADWLRPKLAPETDAGSESSPLAANALLTRGLASDVTNQHGLTL